MTRALDSLTHAIETPSASPLNLLPLRAFFVLQARAYGRTMAAAARVLGISRETLYQDLRAAVATLRQGGRQAAPRCERCFDEPALAGRRIGRTCRNEARRAWEAGYRRERRRGTSTRTKPGRTPRG